MPRKPRCEVTDPESVHVFHLVQRYVRWAWLCREDPHSGQSYEHRRSWIRSRLECLALIFAIDYPTYTLICNHMHSILRMRSNTPGRRIALTILANERIERGPARTLGSGVAVDARAVG